MDLTAKFERAVVLYDKGATLREAASVVGVSSSGLHAFMQRNKLDRRGTGRSLNLTNAQVREIVNMHHRGSMSLTEIAKATGHDRGTIRDLIRDSGSLTFDSRQIRKRLRDRKDAELRDEVKEYAKDGFKLKEIGRILKIDPRRVRRILDG